MPELPEVEKVRRDLQKSIRAGTRVVSVGVSKKPLRFPLQAKARQALRGAKFVSIERRGKYLLWNFDRLTLLSHLGMSGSWRISKAHTQKVHDHFWMELSKKKKKFFAIYNDPRRFGFLDGVISNGKQTLATSRFLKDLGPEPLADDFNSPYLRSCTEKRTAPIKSVLMDAGVVVGVGNIYAAEALYRAKVLPYRSAASVTQTEIDKIVIAIKEVLANAIAAGGSTIRSFYSSTGERGEFQSQHLVYAREGQPCMQCNSIIQNRAIAGRRSDFCPRCQK